MPKIVKYLDLACLAFFLSLLLVGIFFGLSQDILLFKTDLPTLLYFIVAIGFCVSLVFIVPLLLISRLALGSLFHRIGKFLALLVFGLILFGFFANYLDDGVVFNYTLDRLNESIFQGDRLTAYFKTALMLYAMCLLAGYLLSRFLDLKQRVASLARMVAGLALVIVFYFHLNKGLPAGGSFRQSAKTEPGIDRSGRLECKIPGPLQPGRNDSLF